MPKFTMLLSKAAVIKDSEKDEEWGALDGRHSEYLW